MKDQALQEQLISLSERIYPMVYRLLKDEVRTQDAVQDIILKLWDHRSKLKDHPNIIGYAFLSARNHCLDLFKSNQSLPITVEESFEISNNLTGHEDLELKELIYSIEKILETVPKNQREVMIMRDLDGYEFEEIAAATQLPVEHIRVLLSRARKKVRNALLKIYSYEKARE